jgi:hypothetical protein
MLESEDVGTSAAFMTVDAIILGSIIGWWIST